MIILTGNELFSQKMLFQSLFGPDANWTFIQHVVYESMSVLYRILLKFSELFVNMKFILVWKEGIPLCYLMWSLFWFDQWKYSTLSWCFSLIGKNPPIQCPRVKLNRQAKSKQRLWTLECMWWKHYRIDFINYFVNREINLIKKRITHLISVRFGFF